MGAQITFDAPSRVRKLLARLGRTEDVKFSPDSRRLAITGFNKNKLLVLDVDIAVSGAHIEVRLPDFVEVTSPCLRQPHGLCFLDNETLVVANREGTLSILSFRECASNGKRFSLQPIREIRGGVHTPGSVTVSRNGRTGLEILVCNNFAHHVTRHIVDDAHPYEVRSNEVLLGKGLSIPDGIAISPDGRWIAVSNHNAHAVFMYENTTRLGVESDPECVLAGVEYPHGLRFSSDERFVLVADAGAPFVHVYEKDDVGWHGVRHPRDSLRVMDEEIYQRGRHNPQEGGPKGIDIDEGMNVLVTTCEHQALAFFDLQEILKEVESSSTGNTQFEHRNTAALSRVV